MKFVAKKSEYHDAIIIRERERERDRKKERGSFVSQNERIKARIKESREQLE